MGRAPAASARAAASCCRARGRRSEEEGRDPVKGGRDARRECLVRVEANECLICPIQGGRRVAGEERVNGPKRIELRSQTFKLGLVPLWVGNRQEGLGGTEDRRQRAEARAEVIGPGTSQKQSRAALNELVRQEA